jgi:hypothetical protein
MLVQVSHQLHPANYLGLEQERFVLLFVSTSHTHRMDNGLLFCSLPFLLEIECQVVHFKDREKLVISLACRQLKQTPRTYQTRTGKHVRSFGKRSVCLTGGGTRSRLFQLKHWL